MTYDETKERSNFDKSVKVGDIVRINWTNCRRFYSTRGRVTKINAKSILAAILDQVKSDLGVYPEGQQITVPRFLTNGYSANNCAEPFDNP